MNRGQPIPTGLFVTITETAGLGSGSQAKSSLFKTACNDEPMIEQQILEDIRAMRPYAYLDELKIKLDYPQIEDLASRFHAKLLIDACAKATKDQVMIYPTQIFSSIC